MFALGERPVNHRKHEIVCKTFSTIKGLITPLNGIIEDQILEVTKSVGLGGCNLKEKLDCSNDIHKGTI